MIAERCMCLQQRDLRQSSRYDTQSAHAQRSGSSESLRILGRSPLQGEPASLVMPQLLAVPECLPQHLGLHVLRAKKEQKTKDLLVSLAILGAPEAEEQLIRWKVLLAL